MAVRPIDGSELMIEIQACSWDSEQDKERAEDLVLEMPTLTPPNEWVSRVREIEELYTKLHTVTGFTAEQLLEMFAAGYTLEKADHSKDFEEMANLAEVTPPNEPLTVLVNDEPDREYIDYICPRCKNTISQRRRGQRMETVYKCKFHDNCGQRVDWSNPQPYRRPPEGEEDT